jgi:hypothetical protein
MCPTAPPGVYELTKERGQVKIDDVIRVTSAARGTVKDQRTREEIMPAP